MVWLHGIKNSTKDDKRYVAKFCMCDEFDKCKGKNTKIVHFGQKGGQTYIDEGKPAKREAYLARHKVNENWNDPLSAGSLSRFILWGQSTSIAKNISSFRKRFNL